ncbi:RNase A-like domain-containing protein [Kineococcus glutinatus]|uniref:Bacterial CdiA-CT RNAse A domain-containing protein n=1 Tax=Kineococcus glutinatus TaxID=1070872 RepID=A0ABP9HBN9_9ACTN
MSRVALVDGLGRLDPAAAGAAAAALTRTAAQADEVVDALTSARTALPSWEGAALAGYVEATAEVGRRLDLLTGTARIGAALVERHAAELATRRARLVAVGLQAEEVARRLQRVDSTASFGADLAEADRLEQQRQALLAEHDTATAELARRLDALIEDVADRPRSLGEHVRDGVGTFVEQGVVGPLSAAAVLAFGWVTDPRGWWRTVRSLPAGASDAVRHPVQEARRSLRIDDFREGRTGQGIGALAAVVAGRGLNRARSQPPRQRQRAPRDLPPGQPLKDVLAGIDLAFHEGGKAHTLSRHVDVDDQYLRDRLVLGTLERDGTRKLPAPPAASRWVDLATAEHYTTQVLREHEREIRAAMLTGRSRLDLEMPVPSSAGVVMQRDGAGFTTLPARSAFVAVDLSGGTVTVITSYLKETQP